MKTPPSRSGIPAICFSFALAAVTARAAEPPCPTSAPAAATVPSEPAIPAADAPPPAVAGTKGAIDVRSDSGSLGVNGDATLRGNVRVRQGNREIHADEVEYQSQNNSLAVHGNVDYSDPQLRAQGSSGTYSQNGGASFTDAQFELPARNARGTAKEMVLDPDGVLRLKDVSYSTCPAPSPDWQIRARDIKLDTRARVGTGRDARVEFKGVPLIYLPFMSFPLSSDRKSGFLFPSLGNSTRSGLQLSVPYYWNIQPNVDVSFEPQFYSRRGIDAAGELRFLSASSRGSLAVDYLPNDRIAQIDRNRVRLVDRTDLAGEWRVTVHAENVSDSQYFEDFAQGPETTSTAFLERMIALSYRDEHWNLRGELQQFQTIDQTLAQADRPYARAPHLMASGDWGLDPAGALTYGFDSEVVDFQKSGDAVTGWRIDAKPRVGLDWSAPGYFLRPSAGWRFTQYALEDAAPGTARAPSRELPTATLDTGLIFERPSGEFGQRRLTLEPRLLYTYTPYRNQDGLPLFDTAVPDFNTVQLFRTNRYVGSDRVSDANQLAVGVTSRLRSTKDGYQYLAATLGQIYYFDNPRVALPGEDIAGRGTSDVVAQLDLTAYKYWNVNLGMQWNPSASQSERSQLLLQYRPSVDRVINLGYRYQRDSLEQAEFSGAWPIGPRWNVFARAIYSLRDHSALERFAGFEYKACCWRVRAIARRYVSSRTGERDTTIMLQLELNGLASVGTPADAFLAEAIRGYSPPKSSR
ncbi:MAG TPA: LPS assembly protein LptD [Steroidobacteraceae bacterium]